jgi:hypothetical protein
MSAEPMDANGAPTPAPDGGARSEERLRIRVGTWNLNGRGPGVAVRQGHYVRQFELDLLAVQEANPTSLPRFVDAAGLDWAISAADLRVRPPREGRGRWRTSAMVGRGEPPRTTRLFSHLRLPERVIIIETTSPVGRLTAVSYHAPPGVSWKKVKVDHALALARWLETVPGTVIVGVDANTPEVDHPDPALTRTHWHTGTSRLETGEPGDDYMFGPSPSHGLRDALRAWLEQHPAALERIRTERPNGPLAITHRTGKRTNFEGNPVRFDHLWISRDLTVDTIHHEYGAAVDAGSDHALVWADLELARTTDGAS